jgi:hypothetical protein
MCLLLHCAMLCCAVQVLSMQLCGTGSHEHLSQVSDFLFLQPQHMFMTICGHTITTWNFKVCVDSEHAKGRPIHTGSYAQGAESA